MSVRTPTGETCTIDDPFVYYVPVLTSGVHRLTVHRLVAHRPVYDMVGEEGFGVVPHECPGYSMTPDEPSHTSSLPPVDGPIQRVFEEQ